MANKDQYMILLVMQSKDIHIALKKIMRAKGKNYAGAAVELDLSEASVKRLFSSAGLSLNRLEALCNWLGIDIKEVVLESERQQPLITHLSLEQEEELSSNTRLLLVCYLVLNHWKEYEIKDNFEITEAELNKHLIKLEKLGLIELSTFNRIRVLAARNFNWSKNGPVEKFFNTKIVPEFIKTNFNDQNDKMHFVGGMLSESAMIKMHEKLDEVARYFDQLISDDLRLPANKRFGVAMMLGFRRWEFAKILGIEKKNSR